MADQNNERNQHCHCCYCLLGFTKTKLFKSTKLIEIKEQKYLQRKISGCNIQTFLTNKSVLSFFMRSVDALQKNTNLKK